MKVKILKILPKKECKYAYIDANIFFSDEYAIQIKGFRATVNKNKILINLPFCITEKTGNKYSPIIFEKNTWEEFKKVITNAINETYPLYRWKEGNYLHYLYNRN